MRTQYGYEIRLKGTEFVVGDDGGIYFYTEHAALVSANRYLKNSLIPDEFEDKSVDDFDIIVQEMK